MRFHSHAKVSVVLTFTFVTLLVATSCPAAVNTWIGAVDSNWNTPGNWTTTNPGGVPVDGDSLLFAGGTPNNSTTNDISNLLVSGITFDVSAFSYNLSSNAIRLGWQPTGPITHSGDIVSNSLPLQTVALPITLEPGKHTISSSTGTLVLSRPITQLKGSSVIFSSGSLQGIKLTDPSVTNDATGILGGWATIGTDYARIDNDDNVVPYSAYATVAPGGIIADDATQNLRVNTNGTAITTTSPTTHFNSLIFGDGTTAYAAGQTITVGAGNSIVLPQNGGMFNVTGANGNTIRAMTIGSNDANRGTLTAGDGVVPEATITLASTPINVAPQGNGGAFTINSNITDNGSTKVSVVVRGGYVTPGSGAVNTFSGGLYIVSGRWSQPNGNTIGTGPVYIFPGGQINPGASGAVTISNDLFIAGDGTTENNGLGAIRMFQGTDNQSTQLTGTITLMSDASVSANGQTNLIRLTALTGRITGPGGLGIGSQPSNTNANGSGIVVIGPLAGSGTPSDYTGNTTINGTQGGAVGSTLRIGNALADNILPHGATGSFSGGPTGDVVLNANTTARKAVLDLNGSEQTINGLTNTLTSPLDNLVQSSAAGGHLILGDNNATADFSGILQNGTGSLALTKIGGGTQTLTAANTYTGDTKVYGGALSIANSYLADASDITIGADAILNLSFVGTDTIDSLYFGGSPQMTGTWGATGNVLADHTTDRITGTGLLQISSVGILYGDYNDDDVVDAADYAVWRDNEGTSNVLLNDALGGTIGAAHYTQWAANFGSSVFGSAGASLGHSAAVPEPGTATLVLVAIAWGIVRGRRGV